MTRAAARQGLFDAIDALVDVAREEFDPVRALRGSGGAGPGSAVVSKLVERDRLLDRHVVGPEVERYRERARRQVRTMLDAVAAGDPVERRRDSLLAEDVYHGALAADAPPAAREAVATAVVERFRAVADAVEPVVASPADEWWPAVERELTAAEARALVDANFGFSERMSEHRRAFAFETRLDPGDLLGGLGRALPAITVEYTDESLRTMRRAEAAVRRQLEREIDRRFDARAVD